MNTKLLNEFVALTRKKKEAAAELRAIETELAPLRKEVERELIESGTQNWKNEDGAMIYVRRTVIAGRNPDFTDEEVCSALRASGFGWLEKPNYRGLTSVIRERLEAAEVEGSKINVEEAIPPALRGLISIFEDYTAAVRGAGMGED